MPEYLKRPEAADHLSKRGLKITKHTLQKMATTGGGPPYQIFGNISVYTPAGLDAWADAKLRAPKHSTSEDLDDAAA
jgi:hypothetical protein